MKTPILFPTPASANFVQPIHVSPKVSGWLDLGREQPLTCDLLKRLLNTLPREVSVSVDSSLAVEAYRLILEETRLVLTYGSEKGLRYGLQTALQVVNAGGEGWQVEITDEPAIRTRGYMLDISRCKVPTMESLHELIDRLSFLRYNQFQLYTEHTFAYREHEQVWAKASPLTMDEIRELDAYCATRGIELVPNQNSFGHMERWLRHPAYHHLAESPDGFTHPLLGEMPYGTTLYPADEAIRFVDSLYAELLPNFNSRYLNIGGDEPWELGQGRSKERCEREGKHAVYFEFLEKLIKLTKSHERTPMFWADILLEDPAYVEKLPKDIVGLVWGYEANHPFPEQLARFADTGVPYYVVPGTSSWTSLSGRWTNARLNIRSAVDNGLAFGCEGILLTDWGDNGHHQFPFVSHLPLVYTAALLWNTESGSEGEIKAGLEVFYPESSIEGVYQSLLGMGLSDEVFSEKVFNRSNLYQALFYPSAFKKPLPANELAAVRDILHALPGLDGNGTSRAEYELTRQLLLIGAGEHCSCSQSEILEEYRRLWLARNRPGGLEESTEKLQAALARV